MFCSHLWGKGANESSLGKGSSLPGGSCSCRHGKGILTEAASFLCLVLTGPQPLLLSLQMHLLARASVPPCHVLTSLSFLTETQQSQKEEKKSNPRHLTPIQTSQRCENRETYFERDLCADVSCRCLSSLCACQGHEMTFEPFVGPFLCVAGRK